MTDWRPDLITDVLNNLTPESVRIGLISQQFADKCTSTEPWYGAKYNCEKIPAEKIEAWTNCGLHEKLRNVQIESDKLKTVKNFFMIY